MNLSPEQHPTAQAYHLVTSQLPPLHPQSVRMTQFITEPIVVEG